MSKALQTVEQGNLYASFGLIEDLSEDEMMDIDGGWCGCNGLSINIGCSGNSSSSSSSSSGRGDGGSSHGSSPNTGCGCSGS